MQFGIEGVGRIIVTTLVIFSFQPSLTKLIILNVMVQFLSVTVPVIRYRWLPKIKTTNAPLSQATELFLPLWFAAFAIQSLLSLTPFFARVIGNATPIYVAALGGLVQIIRIPVTFSSPVTLPHLNVIAARVADAQFRYIRQSMDRIILILGGIWATYGVTVIVAGITIDLSRLAFGSVISFPLLFAIFCTSICAPTTIFLHSVSLILRLKTSISIAWISAFLVYLTGIYLFGNTATGSIYSIATGFTLSGSVLLVAIRAKLSETSRLN